MTVSVVVPAYNAVAFLPLTVPAVLDLDDVAEWIWVDDGSTDTTVEELERLTAGHPRVRIRRMERNRGRAAARNAGIEMASGDVIAFLDADARPRGGYLEAHRRVLAHSEATVSMGRIHPADPVPGDPYSVYLSTYPRGPGSAEGSTSWKHFVTCAACARSSALRSTGGFDEAIGYGEDAELACRLASFSPTGLHVASEAVVDLFGTETLTGACEKAMLFGQSLRHIVASNPGALAILELASLNSFASQWLAGSGLLRPLVESLLPHMPDRLVRTAVRYLLGHALYRGYSHA